MKKIADYVGFGNFRIIIVVFWLTDRVKRVVPGAFPVSVCLAVWIKMRVKIFFNAPQIYAQNKTGPWERREMGETKTRNQKLNWANEKKNLAIGWIVWNELSKSQVVFPMEYSSHSEWRIRIRLGFLICLFSLFFSFISAKNALV